MYWITMELGGTAQKQLYDAGQDTSLGHLLYTQLKLRPEEGEEESLSQAAVEGESPCQEEDEKDRTIG